MANKDKKAAKAAAKAQAATQPKKAVEPTASTETEKAPEAPAAAPATAPTAEIKKEEAAPAAPQVNNPKKEKKSKIAEAVAEVVEPVTVESPAEPVEPIYSRIGASIKGNDRFSHSDALKLGEMFKAEFAEDPEATKEQKAFAKMQVRGLLLNEMLFYNAQVKEDFQTLGVKVDNRMFVMLETQAREYYGITLVGLPIPGHPDQKMIDFGKSEIPAEVEKAVVADKKARTEVVEIPEADPKMSDEEKLKTIRAIMSQKIGRGANFVSAINWAKKAYELSEANIGQILTAVFDKFSGNDPVLLSGTTNAVNGKFMKETSILGVHALLKMWYPTYSDEEISEIAVVTLSRATEKRIADWNARFPDKTLSSENEFALMNRRIRMSSTPDVIAGIIAKNEAIPLKDEDGKEERLFNGLQCYNNFTTAYGDSPSIIADKLPEIVKLYTKPLDRLAAYKDKSAYAK